MTAVRAHGHVIGEVHVPPVFVTRSLHAIAGRVTDAFIRIVIESHRDGPRAHARAVVDVGRGHFHISALVIVVTNCVAPEIAVTGGDVLLCRKY